MKTVYRMIGPATALWLGVMASHAVASPSLCDSTAGNLVANCGFETADFTHWTLAGTDFDQGLEGNLFGVETTDPLPPPAGTDPNSGSYQAFFADQAMDPLTLSQTVATAAPGLYAVSFYLAQQLVGPGTVNNSVDVSFGGQNLTDLINVTVQDYSYYSFTAPITYSTALLSFTFGNDTGEFLLDDISVSVSSAQVPEPSSAGLLSAGLLALAAYLLRQSTT
jgi:hypothetical protein